MSSKVSSTHPTDTLRTVHSVAAGTGGVIGPQYASSKSAMHGLIHWLSQRYCKEGIVSYIQLPVLDCLPGRIFAVDEWCCPRAD